MKVTVKDYLNVRVGKPSVNAPTFQYLAPGSEIETDGLSYPGDLYEGIDAWVKDLAENYYWSGGLSLSNIGGPQQFIPEKMSWGHKWYNIPFIWNDLDTMGQGVTVAVIDTGVDYSHPDLSSKIHASSKSFINQSSEINDIDGHGTNMAGIIGASGIKVFGVAPDSKLLILKASDQVRGANSDLFAQALDYASTIEEVDIISISSILTDTVTLRKAINKCLLANKILVAAIGNSRDFIGLPNGPDPDTFPACYPKVLAIGAFDNTGKICSFSNWNANLSFLSPGDFSILTTGLNNTTSMGTGTSIATAFSAGCLALMLAYAKVRPTPIDKYKCVAALLNTCDDIGPTIGKDIQSGFGRMNLRNAINKIKNL